VRLRLLGPLASFRPFERSVLAGLFPGGGSESTSALLRARYRVDGFDPEASLRAALPVAPAAVPAGRALGTALLGTIALAGVALQARAVADADLLPLVLLANFVGGALLLRLWPRHWWHGGRTRRSLIGLLLPLLALTTAVAALQLAVARPQPVPAWAASMLSALACYALMLVGGRMPARGEPFATLRALGRIRRDAAAELRRPAPRLSDAWVAAPRGPGPRPRPRALARAPRRRRAPGPRAGRHGRGLPTGATLHGPGRDAVRGPARLDRRAVRAFGRGASGGAGGRGALLKPPRARRAAGEHDARHPESPVPPAGSKDPVAAATRSFAPRWHRRGAQDDVDARAPVPAYPWPPSGGRRSRDVHPAERLPARPRPAAARPPQARPASGGGLRRRRPRDCGSALPGAGRPRAALSGRARRPGPIAGAPGQDGRSPGTARPRRGHRRRHRPGPGRGRLRSGARGGGGARAALAPARQPDADRAQQPGVPPRREGPAAGERGPRPGRRRLVRRRPAQAQDRRGAGRRGARLRPGQGPRPRLGAGAQGRPGAARAVGELLPRRLTAPGAPVASCSPSTRAAGARTSRPTRRFWLPTRTSRS
jgi:hypothetical protein